MPSTIRAAEPMAHTLVRWQAVHGRHDLPWQANRDPYPVWLSEIMLQQTQVATVRDYFVRFMARFPDVHSLARAQLDEVLALWSGLGYYARARHLHRCAQHVVHLYGGVFPRTAAQLQSLPGIGRSSAAAIAALCFAERVAILDGNAKRVLARYLGFTGDLADRAQEQTLWQHATQLLPQDDLAHNMPRYTQALMDLGAQVCSVNTARCAHCPLQANCRAHAMGNPRQFPIKTRRSKRSTEAIWLLWAVAPDGALWLSRRPSPGIWAGLYCFALYSSEQQLRGALPAELALAAQSLCVVKHVLTHKDLYLHPIRLQLPHRCALDANGDWLEQDRWPALGLPAPIRKLLENAALG